MLFFCVTKRFNLINEQHKNNLFEVRTLISQYNYLFEFFMSLQDPSKDYLARNYELFDTKMHNEGEILQTHFLLNSSYYIS